MHSVLNNSKGLIGRPAGHGGGKAGEEFRGLGTQVHQKRASQGSWALFPSGSPGLLQVASALLTFARSLVKNSLRVFRGQTVCEELRNTYTLTSCFSRKNVNTMRFLV